MQAIRVQLGTGLADIITDDGASVAAALPDTGAVQVRARQTALAVAPKATAA